MGRRPLVRRVRNSRFQDPEVFIDLDPDYAAKDVEHDYQVRRYVEPQLFGPPLSGESMLTEKTFDVFAVPPGADERRL